mmetsp:Transcript_25170/g.49539  ORF Transcript_25170/g.49539 Transcript_25170/m.49539 type:complete len:1279 (-) Transcript_25170:2-3838(-)
MVWLPDRSRVYAGTLTGKLEYWKVIKVDEAYEAKERKEKEKLPQFLFKQVVQQGPKQEDVGGYRKYGTYTKNFHFKSSRPSAKATQSSRPCTIRAVQHRVLPQTRAAGKKGKDKEKAAVAVAPRDCSKRVSVYMSSHPERYLFATDPPKERHWRHLFTIKTYHHQVDKSIRLYVSEIGHPRGSKLSLTPEQPRQASPDFFDFYAHTEQVPGSVQFTCARNGSVYKIAKGDELAQDPNWTDSFSFWAWEEKEKEEKGHTDAVTGMLYVPAMDILYTCSMDGTILLWEVTSGLVKTRFTGHQAGVSAIAYSDHYRFLVSAGLDHVIGVWNPFEDKLMYKLTAHFAPLLSVYFIDETPQMVSGDEDGWFKIWDCRNFSCVQSFKYEGPSLSSFCISNDYHRRIFAVGNNGFCGMYDQEGGPYVNTGDDEPIFAALWNATFSTFVTVTRFDVKIWNGLTGGMDGIYKGWSTSDITAVCLHGKDKKIVIGDHSGKIRMYNFATGTFIKHFQGHDDEISFLCYCPGEDKVISAAVDNIIRVHSDEKDRGNPEDNVLMTIKLPCDAEITHTAYGSKYHKLAISATDGNLYMWSIDIGGGEDLCQPIHRSDKALVTSLTFLGEYPILVTGDQMGGISLFSFSTHPVSDDPVFRFKIPMPEEDVRFIDNSNDNKKKQNPVTVMTFDVAKDVLWTGDASSTIHAFDMSPILEKLNFTGDWRERMEEVSDSATARLSSVPTLSAIEEVVPMVSIDAGKHPISSLQLVPEPPCIISTCRVPNAHIWSENGTQVGVLESIKQAELWKEERKRRNQKLLLNDVSEELRAQDEAIRAKEAAIQEAKLAAEKEKEREREIARQKKYKKIRRKSSVKPEEPVAAEQEVKEEGEEEPKKSTKPKSPEKAAAAANNAEGAEMDSSKKEAVRAMEEEAALAEALEQARAAAGDVWDFEPNVDHLQKLKDKLVQDLITLIDDDRNTPALASTMFKKYGIVYRNPASSFPVVTKAVGNQRPASSKRRPKQKRKLLRASKSMRAIKHTGKEAAQRPVENGGDGEELFDGEIEAQEVPELGAVETDGLKSAESSQRSNKKQLTTRSLGVYPSKARSVRKSKASSAGPYRKNDSLGDSLQSVGDVRARFAAMNPSGKSLSKAASLASLPDPLKDKTMADRFSAIDEKIRRLSQSSKNLAQSLELDEKFTGRSRKSAIILEPIDSPSGREMGQSLRSGRGNFIQSFECEDEESPQAEESPTNAFQRQNFRKSPQERLHENVTKRLNEPQMTAYARLQAALGSGK